MKNSDELKVKREFPKGWKPTARVPKECLRDIGDIRLEFIGELAPRSNKRIPVITVRAGDWDENDGNKQ